jgi:hypothetical protein
MPRERLSLNGLTAQGRRGSNPLVRGSNPCGPSKTQGPRSSYGARFNTTTAASSAPMVPRNFLNLSVCSGRSVRLAAQTPANSVPSSPLPRLCSGSSQIPHPSSLGPPRPPRHSYALWYARADHVPPGRTPGSRKAIRERPRPQSWNTKRFLGLAPPNKRHSCRHHGEEEDICI